MQRMGRLHAHWQGCSHCTIPVAQLSLWKLNMAGRPAEPADCAGNAIVQFATSRYDPFQYAVKFYTNAAQFQTEACVLSGGLFTAPSTPTPPLWLHRNRAQRDKQLGDTLPRVTHPHASTEDDRQTRLAFLPPVVGIYAAGSTRLQDPQGWPLPPCVVMQRGESLQDWMGRPSSDRGRSNPTAVRLSPVAMQELLK